MKRIKDDTSTFIVEDRFSFLKINAVMFGLIEDIFLWIPNEGKILHTYNICT